MGLLSQLRQMRNRSCAVCATRLNEKTAPPLKRQITFFTNKGERKSKRSNWKATSPQKWKHLLACQLNTENSTTVFFKCAFISDTEQKSAGRSADLLTGWFEERPPGSYHKQMVPLRLISERPPHAPTHPHTPTHKRASLRAGIRPCIPQMEENMWAKSALCVSQQYHAEKRPEMLNVELCWGNGGGRMKT